MTTVTPTETDLLPLFEKWAALEPDRARVNKLNEALVFFQSSWYIFDVSTTLKPMQLAIVQATLQESVRDRRWRFTLWGNDETYTADVFVFVNAFADATVYTHECLDPAIALLSAYLQALEAAA